MSNLTSAINVMVDSEVKEGATIILKDLGLSMSSAINLFLRQVIKRDGLPFEVINYTPNNDTLFALKEAEEIYEGKKKVKKYNNREDLKKDLLEDEEI